MGVEYHFIAITLSSTLTQSDNTCLGLNFKSNRSVQKLFISIGPCSKKTSSHKITLDMLTCCENQSIKIINLPSPGFV